MTTTQTDKINLLGLDRKAMEDFFGSLGEKSYRAQQALKAIHFQGLSDIQQMSNFSKPLRDKIALIAEIIPPNITFESTAPDGTHKWVVRLVDGNCIETVFIPEKKPRDALCLIAGWLHLKLRFLLHR